MRKLLLLLLFTVVTTMVPAQKYVGGDISMLTKYEDAGVIYKDKNGNAVQPLPFFKGQGLNAMRVRLFVDPSLDNDKAVCQDLEYVKALGKRIKDQGMAFMLDFHYSDTWADPGKQWTPDAWKTLSDAELYEKIYEYSKDCLQQLKDAGATPDFIQTGNEISYGMLWGIKGTTANRCYTNSSDANWTRFTLETALTSLENKNYGKDIMIVETGYSYAWSIGGEYDYTATYPYTEEGQRQFTADLIAKLNGHSSVKGLFWWWPEDNGNKGVTNSWWNAALYNHSTGQPYAAFYELKNFNGGSAGMQSVRSADNKDNVWYTLDGRKLNGTPQTKGIYIKNNQKIIVR